MKEENWEVILLKPEDCGVVVGEVLSLFSVSFVVLAEIYQATKAQIAREA